MNRDDFERIAVNGGLTAHPYEMMVWLGVLIIRNWAQESGRAGASIAYFFEAGHSAQRSANAMMNKVFLKPELRKLCMYKSHTFISKEDARPCQAADLLAWQWYTDKKRRDDPRFTKSRYDFQKLMEHGHQFIHADSNYLQNTMGGLAQMYG